MVETFGMSAYSVVARQPCFFSVVYFYQYQIMKYSLFIVKKFLALNASKKGMVKAFYRSFQNIKKIQIQN